MNEQNHAQTWFDRAGLISGGAFTGPGCRDRKKNRKQKLGKQAGKMERQKAGSRNSQSLERLCAEANKGNEVKPPIVERRAIPIRHRESGRSPRRLGRRLALPFPALTEAFCNKE
jgi:hypothetical protein